MVQEITNAKHLTDFVFIRVPSRIKNTIGSFHLATSAKILQDNFTPDDEVSDKPLNEELNIRTSGIVVAAPDRLTPINLYENYLGTPRYTPYINHEVIKDTILRMPIKMQKKYGRNMYYPGNPPESFQTQPNNPEIEVGDKIYFEYNVLLDESAFVDRDPDGEVYKIPYQSIYCFVRNEEIHMINGWVFVKSVEREEMKSVIILVNNKPQPNVGEIAHISHWLDRTMPEKGDKCIFTRTLFSIKEFESMTDSHTISGYEVEEELYYPMRNWEIVAVNRDGKLLSVGDFVKIKPERVNYISKVDTIEFKKGVHQPFKAGQIFTPQGSVTHKKENKVLSYGIGVYNGNRVAYGKSSLYIYLDNIDILFVHKSDIWGTFLDSIDSKFIYSLNNSD